MKSKQKQKQIQKRQKNKVTKNKLKRKRKGSAPGKDTKLHMKMIDERKRPLRIAAGIEQRTQEEIEQAIKTKPFPE